MIPALLMGAGVGLSAFGMYANAQAQKAQMEFNARQRMVDAEIALRTADENARLLRKHGRALTGKQRTQYAISGVRMEGTPLEVMASTIENIEIDAINQRAAGRFGASQTELQAGFEKSMGSSAGMAGTIGAAGSLLSGGAQTYSMWKKD